MKICLQKGTVKFSGFSPGSKTSCEQTLGQVGYKVLIGLITSFLWDEDGKQTNKYTTNYLIYSFFFQHSLVSMTSKYHFFQKIFKRFCLLICYKFSMVKYFAHIQNRLANCIKMSSNKPMFGPVVLEMICDIFIDMISSFHLKRVVCVQKSINRRKYCVS